jgi:hypothetical protein
LCKRFFAAPLHVNFVHSQRRALSLKMRQEQATQARISRKSARIISNPGKSGRKAVM